MLQCAMTRKVHGLNKEKAMAGRVVCFGERLLRLVDADGDVPFKAWLLRIAINLGKNQVRDGARWLRVLFEAVDGAK